MLMRRALTGDAKLLISHFRDDELLRWDAGQRIFDVLVQVHKHISEFEDQDDFDNAFYKLHTERNQTFVGGLSCFENLVMTDGLAPKQQRFGNQDDLQTCGKNTFTDNRSSARLFCLGATVFVRSARPAAQVQRSSPGGFCPVQFARRY